MINNMNRIQKSIPIVIRYLFGIFLYALPIWILVFIHMGFHPWSYISPSKDIEGDLWILILALLHTIWSIPGFTLFFWLNRRNRVFFKTSILFSFLSGTIVACLYLPVESFLDKHYFSIVGVLNLTGEIGQEGSGIIMIFLSPLICIVLGAWFSIKLLEIVTWLKPSWFL